MLLDNKTTIEEDEPFKVFEFVKKYTENGSLEIVTGYFSVNALASLQKEINSIEKCRLILGHLMQEDNPSSKVIDLLNANLSIISALELNESARKAVEFLSQNKVAVKIIQKNFCHAKVYLYTDKVKTKNYFIVGSSNLTDAGLGIKDSSNIELNVAKHDYEDEFKNLKKWFQQLWEKTAIEKIELPNKTKIEVKQYFIDLIRNLYKEYSPQDLYYKVLYEIFKNDILELSINTDFKREIAHLEETTIYRSLYSFQQKGVISLIKMIQKYNGAILADAVGLGKTWTALAVMKYFELKGYTILMLCPKKLSQNWEQYKVGGQSRFEKDEIDFYIRYHTDLQEGRFERYTDKSLRFFQTRPKLLIVIDESHNLRNDKSLRYKFLVEQLLIPQNTSREVKVLQLSATPINNELIDIRNQFKLIAQGQDDGFKNTDLEIDSLESLFRSVQRDFNEWEKKQTRKIADFIAKLPKKFEKLSDSLIVARTRKLIENEFGTLKFPTKEKPINEYISPENIDKLRSLEDILDALFINLTAYRPADYMQVQEPKNVLHDEKQRQRYLVKMMYILLVKRLESCWFSFKITIENILKYHFEVLSKVKQFLETRKDNLLEEKIDEEYKEELEETAIQLQSADFITLGKKQPIRISTITDLERFRKDLEIDIQKLSYLKENLENYQKDFLHGKVQDEKLNKLLEHITQKQQNLSNKKVLVFTSFKDTAKFLYEELKKRGITNIAFVSGTISESADGYVSSKFEAILERFAPYTKLYLEKDWSSLYEKCLPESYQEAGKWNVSYEKWKEIISKYDTITYYKLAHPIDVLIATDCLSEGQNLQDCDMVINYDIHWNPVRLIQRMGRIDRIGSPNSTITGINFWPAKSYEDYLNLKKKVENRMALMTIVGTEVDDKLTPELERTIQENPILTHQAQKMLQQLQLTWEDVETNEETLGFNDLSLEQFRQELFEYFKRNEEYFKNIPNGVFTGFRLKPHHKWQNIPSSLVAVLGYPKRTDSQDTQHKYREIYLLHQSIEAQKNDAKFLLTNFQEILSMLRYHKTEPRYVPREIDNGDKEILQKLASRLHQWIYAQASTSAVNQIQDLFTGDMKPLKISPEEKKLEEKFIPENFDLINWFVISET